MKGKGIWCIALLILCLSCNKENEKDIFVASSYPLALGNWWKYQHTSIGFEPDTFILRIDSVTNDGLYKKYICNSISGNTIVPAGYFLRSDTSIAFIYPSEYYYLSEIQNFHIRFPISQDSYWMGDFSGDSTKVIGVNDSYSSYNIATGPYYSIHESYNLPHNFKVFNMTISPKLGILSQTNNFRSDTVGGFGVNVNQSILLLGYFIQ